MTTALAVHTVAHNLSVNENCSSLRLRVHFESGLITSGHVPQADRAHSLNNAPFVGLALYMYIISPVPKSYRGNRFALVSIDGATKYPDAVPRKRKYNVYVAKSMIEIHG